MTEIFLQNLKDPNICRLDFLTVLFRVLLAVMAGAMVGYERGRHGRAAGLRTHILLCLGASLTAMTGIYVTTSAGMGDPTRAAAGVVSGIGFLCAGIILNKSSRKVIGLTTAAAMWTTALIGIALGSGFYLGGITAALVLFVSLTWMTRMEVRQKIDLRYYLELDDVYCTNETVSLIREKFPEAHSFDAASSKSGMEHSIGIYVNIVCADKKAVVEALQQMPHVVFVINE